MAEVALCFLKSFIVVIAIFILLLGLVVVLGAINRLLEKIIPLWK